MKNRFKKLLSETVTTKIFTGRKLDLCFNKKDETNLEHKHDITYHGKCSENDCPNNYFDATKRRLPERIKDHWWTDTLYLL